MVKAEATRWQALLVRRAYRIDTRISGRVRVCGHWSHKRMENVGLEGDGWWPARIVFVELNLKPEHSICIRTFSFSQHASSGK